MPARPPLRTVRESFPSYGSSLSNRCTLVWARGGELQPVCDDSSRRWGPGRRNGSRAWAHASTETAALFEVSRVMWVVGVCGPSDFDMALYFGAGGQVEREHLALALLLGEPHAEEPLLWASREVLALPPGGRLIGVALFGPAPELPEDKMVQPFKGPLGSSMSVVVGPAPDDGVELAQEHFLVKSQGGVDAESDFVQQVLEITLCRRGQKFVPKFAHGVPQKVEPFINVGDDGLLL